MDARTATMLAVGTGLLAGALFEFTLGVDRDVRVCDERGVTCTTHYSPAGFTILMFSLVVGVVGAALVWTGLRRVRLRRM